MLQPRRTTTPAPRGSSGRSKFLELATDEAVQLLRISQVVTHLVEGWLERMGGHAERIAAGSVNRCILAVQPTPMPATVSHRGPKRSLISARVGLLTATRQWKCAYGNITHLGN